MGGSSDSSSFSSPTSNVATSQTTGGSGQESPTVNAGGGVTIQSSGGAVSLAALSGMQAVIQAALNNAGNVNASSLGLLSDFNANEAAAQVQQQNNNQSLLASVLANNQTLAENVQSGGATTGMDMSTKVIYVALGLVGVIVTILLFKK